MTLLDNTYATNLNKMLMINVLTVNINNLYLSAGVSFVEKEVTESFGWALRQLGRVMRVNNIELP